MLVYVDPLRNGSTDKALVMSRNVFLAQLGHLSPILGIYYIYLNFLLSITSFSDRLQSTLQDNEKKVGGQTELQLC